MRANDMSAADPDRNEDSFISESLKEFIFIQFQLSEYH